MNAHPLYHPNLRLFQTSEGYLLESVTYVANSCIQNDGDEKKAPSGTVVLPESFPVSLKLKHEGDLCSQVITPVIHRVSIAEKELAGRTAIVCFSVLAGATLGASSIPIDSAIETRLSEVKTQGVILGREAIWPDSMQLLPKRLNSSARMLVAAFLLCSPAVRAAITDADLSKITQLIQQGKTERAKAQITILLDDNPNEPNASKLKKILDSLGSSTVTSSNQIYTAASTSPDGPSEKETIEWIKSHLGELNSSIGVTADSIEVKGDALVLTWVDVDVRNGDGYGTMIRVCINLRKVLGSVELRTSIDGSFLDFTTDVNGVEIAMAFYKEAYPAQAWLNGQRITVPSDRISSLRESIEKKALPPKTGSFPADWPDYGCWKQSQYHQYVSGSPDRLKKAFDHLIQLHGGGKPEPF